jgi:hypothetical protein
MIEPKFQPGDYIINISAGDMAIVDKITKKGYYHFKAYYENMFHKLKDAKNPLNDLQINYQKFWDLCNDEEKNKLNEIIKAKK